MKLRVLLVCALLMGGSTSQIESAPKNVILIVTDDQGRDAGCYGNKIIKTPNLDTLAKDGTRFDYAFCTTASCSASRSVILTGLFNHANAQYGHQHSYHHFRTYKKLATLPTLMSDMGYRTARVGKYHVGPPEVYPFETVLKGNSRNPVEMANNCKEVISANSDKPFFLYYCTSDPHRGGGVIEESKLKPNRFGNTPKGYPGVKEVTYDPKTVIVPPFLPNTQACREELAQYYQSVSRVDQGLGRLMSILKEAKQWNNTLIIYISDHGIAMPGAKTTVYEPGLRSPCVVRNPYLKSRGNATNAMISWVDLTPTIVDFAGGLPKDHRFHGRSFLPVLENPQSKGWDEIFASHTFHEITMYYPMRVVRGRRYKLIWNIAHPLQFPFASDLWAAPTWQDVYKKGQNATYGKRTVKAYMSRPQFELYDLENDPDEVINLATDPRHTKVLANLKTKIKAFQTRTKDPWILKWKYE